MDLVFLLGTALFIALICGMAAGCERLGAGK